jgi:LysR family transcriptional regulator, hydrogen peroxide-inducible genes activator
VALPHDHRLAAERRITPSALISEAIVLLEEGHCLRDQSLSICGAAGLNNCRDDVQAAGLETLCQMVMAGIGIALVPELATQGPLAPANSLSTAVSSHPSRRASWCSPGAAASRAVTHYRSWRAD